MRAARLAAVSLLASLCAGAGLEAQGSQVNLEFSFSNPGARSLGLGGAFAALADDATAAYANPAGLVQLVRPEVSLNKNYKHLRRLLRVQDESGRKLAFRFYDPRVLRVYLPTCTAEEAKQFFGPVPRILAESEDAKKLLSYRCGTSGVETEEIPLT